MIITSVERIPAPGMVYLKKCWSELIVCDHLGRSISPVVSSPEIMIYYDSIMHRTGARADRFQRNCNSFSRIVDRDISSYYNANLPH